MWAPIPIQMGWGGNEIFEEIVSKKTIFHRKVSIFFFIEKFVIGDFDNFWTIYNDESKSARGEKFPEFSRNTVLLH